MSETLIGRDPAIDRARSLLDRHGVVVVTGASGIGKTAVVDEVAGRWRAEGRPVVEIRGSFGLQDVPFGALARLLDGRAGSATEAAASISSAIRGFEPSTLLVVDDAHLLDQASAGLLAGLVPADGLAVALTVTSGEPLPADLPVLWSDPDRLLELGPLSPEQVGEMAADVLGRRLPAPDVEQLYTITLGYPLYVAAIAGETASGSPLAHDRLSALLERRLARLGRPERHLFDRVAFAEAVPIDAIVRLDPDGRLRELEARGLVRVRGAHVEVAHPLLASVATATLTLDGRRACATDLLAAIDDFTDPADVGRVARAAVAVGVMPEPDRLETAARAAMTSGDHAGVLTLTARMADDPRFVAIRAEAQRFLGSVPEAMPAGLDDDALTAYLSQRSQALAFVERRYEEATDVLAEGLDLVETPAHRNRLALELMTLSGLVGDLDSLLHAARSLGGGVDADTQLLALSTSLVAEGLTLATGTSDETYRQGRALADAGAGAGDPFLVDRLEMSRALVDLAEGRFHAARDRFGGERRALGPWLTIEALLADAWSSLDAAIGVADEAVAALESFDPLGNLPQARALAALRRAQGGTAPPGPTGGNLEAGVAAIDRLMDDRVDGWVRHGRGDPGAGLVLARAGRAAVDAGHRFWGLGCFIDAIRMGCGPDVAADVDQLAVTRGAGLARLASRAARAGSDGECWEVARAWWDAGAPTYAIEAATRAGRAPTSRAGAQLLATAGASPVVESVPDDLPLTERQAHVLLAALRGASNREIAESLFLSKRTVDNHLHAAYAASGLDGRDELVNRFGWIMA